MTTQTASETRDWVLTRTKWVEVRYCPNCHQDGPHRVIARNWCATRAQFQCTHCEHKQVVTL